MKNITVLIADGTPDTMGDSFDINGVDFPKEVTLVKEFSHSFDDVVGFAKLRKEGNRVLADLEFVNDIFVPEVRKYLYPAVGGKVITKEGGKIMKCVIDTISIGGSPNADSRIKRLGE